MKTRNGFFIFCLAFLFPFISCKKQDKESKHPSFVENYPDEEFVFQSEGKENLTFYEDWERDSVTVFQRLPDLDRQIVYTDTRKETEEYRTRQYFIMRDADKKIVKLSETDELNDGSLKTILVAYFQEGELIYIEYMNDVIDEPGMSYFIKSAVRDEHFIPGHFTARTRMDFGKEATLPLEKASPECIFNALVLYDRMKNIYEK
ncbi:MAG: hypothetical protein LUG18_11780 [Candidatus Azobacteroides sp.]|nr:hypothetical protein [Candidatus Azobacteroides sp.]